MYTQRSSRLPRASKRRSPSPVIERRLRGKRQRTGLRKTKEANGIVDTDEAKGHDIIDLINSMQARHRKDEETRVEVVDEGLDDSDEDCVSVSSSIASGPSFLHSSSPKKPRSLQGFCSACKARYRKAKKMRAPIKDKLLDNDPKSLTCDQWVLIKKWRPRRLPNARGKLLIHVQLVKKRLRVMHGAKRPVQSVGGSSACLRPHAFLQRNLRRRVRAPMKKKNRGKRTRDDSQGPRVAKQQRLHSNNHRQHFSHTGGLISSPEVNDQADRNLTVQLIPSAVAMETTKPSKVPPKQKAPKRMVEFRDLLAQLRGNSSFIVKEMH